MKPTSDNSQGAARTMNAPCSHTRVSVISQDDNGKFLECLDCREIFELSELEEPQQSPSQAKEELPKEDLSDA